MYLHINIFIYLYMKLGSPNLTHPPSYVKLNGLAGKFTASEPAKSTHTG
jgi:hypothetical protein